MGSTIRRLFALAGALVVLTVGAPSAVAATFHSDELRLAARGVAASAAGAVALSPAPCNDTAYKKLGGKQASTYAWSFNAVSTPGYLARTAVRDTLVKSFSNITNASNDCGMPDKVSATHTFLGSTRITAKCNRRDLRNVIGFRKLEYGILAMTCFWTNNGRIVEADIQINSRERWALTLKGCVNELMLEATMTHEAGHVFGLDHVGERRHGRLTMSPYIDGTCEIDEASLGKGDVLGLEALY